MSSIPSSIRFLLSTPEHNIAEESVEKIRLHLTTGILEVLNRHQPFLGKIDNNLIEITREKKRTFFLLREAICYLYLDTLNDQTTVCIYGKNVREINSSLSIPKVLEECEKKKVQIEKEEKKLLDKTGKTTNPKLEILKNDLKYLENIIFATKKFKETEFI